MPGMCARHFVFAALLATLAARTGHAQDYAHYRGSWEGDFMLSVTQPDVGARTPAMVVPGRLHIETDGSVRGEMPEIGCKMSGTSADFVSPANATLEVDLSGCTDPRFNGHFNGRLITHLALRHASVRLASLRSLDAATVQVTAVIRR